MQDWLGKSLEGGTHALQGYFMYAVLGCCYHPDFIMLLKLWRVLLLRDPLWMQGWNGKSLETHGSAHALQGHFMEAVARDRDLQSLATDAFRSSVRAYAAYPVAVKNVFHVKKLHIGHVAHSFALR